MAMELTSCPLATFALNTYRDDPCSCFELKDDPDYDPK